MKNFYYNYPQIFIPVLVIGVVILTLLGSSLLGSDPDAEIQVITATPAQAAVVVTEEIAAPSPEPTTRIETVEPVAEGSATEAVIPSTIEAVVAPEITAEASTPVPAATSAEPVATSAPVVASAGSGMTSSLSILEGAVSAINVNTLTIFGITIEVDPAHPIWEDLRLGDTVRVEGTANFEGAAFTLVPTNIIRLDIDQRVVDGVRVEDLPAGCTVAGVGSGTISCEAGNK